MSAGLVTAPALASASTVMGVSWSPLEAAATPVPIAAMTPPQPPQVGHV